MLYAIVLMLGLVTSCSPCHCKPYNRWTPPDLEQMDTDDFVRTSSVSGI